MVLVVKNPPANTGDVRDADSTPGWGRSPGGGHGNPPQYSCLENPRDQGVWWATVQMVGGKELDMMKQLSTRTTLWKEVSRIKRTEHLKCIGFTQCHGLSE